VHLILHLSRDLYSRSPQKRASFCASSLRMNEVWCTVTVIQRPKTGVAIVCRVELPYGSMSLLLLVNSKGIVFGIGSSRVRPWITD